MKTSWMEELVQSWSSDQNWTQDELRALTAELMALGRLNRGLVFGEPELTNDEAKAWAIACVTGALDGSVRSYVRYIARDDERKFVDVPTPSFQVDLPFVAAKVHSPAININTATAEELEALPGLGPRTAAKVVEHRRHFGTIASLEELKKIAGLDAEAVKRLASFAYAGPPSDQTRVTSPALDEFQKTPTFASYARLILSTGLALSRFGADVRETPKQRLLREVRGLREEQEQRPSHPYRYTPGTDADVVRARTEVARKAAAIRERTIAEQMHGALLDDSDYPFFVEQLVKSSQNRIHIIMFFMRFEDAARYPTDALFSELVAAKKRGVAIRVILDQDAEGDSINSRVINEEAYQFLSDNAIPVVYDSEERYTHTKLVTVDGEHVVLGSHNWTAGSFFAYDDTSVYIHSATLAEHYDQRFDKLWEEYGGS